MLKHAVFIISIVLLLGADNSYAEDKVVAGDKPVVVEQKSAQPPTAEKDTQAQKTADNKKYAPAYVKCTKAASENEAKYDELFTKCMGENGFPQEDYMVYGKPLGHVMYDD